MIPVIMAVAAAIVLWTTTVFNRIQELADEAREGWDRLAMHLRRRHEVAAELVRELTDVVDFDDDLLETVGHVNTTARETLGRVGLDHGVRAAARSQATLSEVLSQLKVTLGRYPDWHPRRQIQVLLQDVADAEASSGEALRTYNQAAFTLNSQCERSGWSIIARLARTPCVEIWTDLSHTSSGPAPAIREHDATHH